MSPVRPHSSPLDPHPRSIFKDIPPRDHDVILWVRAFFPELDDVTITFKLMKSSRYLGICEWERNMIRLTRKACAQKGVIAHELTHMASHHCGGIPKGEKACEIWTLARSPLLNDVQPSYLDIPRSVKQRWSRDDARALSDLARTAIRLREEGKRQYIRWFEENARNADVYINGASSSGLRWARISGPASI